MKIKCGGKRDRSVIYPWIIGEIKPVLDELGISTPEELGYDKPVIKQLSISISPLPTFTYFQELFIPAPNWWWEKSWYKEYGLDKMEGYKHFA